MSINDDNEISEITRIVLNWNQGDIGALDELMQVSITKLRRIAKSNLKKFVPQNQFLTMQTTEIVNEAYLKLHKIKQSEIKIEDQFFALCAEVIKNIVIDYARRKSAERRGGTVNKISLDDPLNFPWDPEGKKQAIDEVILFQEVLTKLEVENPRAEQIVSLKYYLGLTDEEIAANLRISIPTVRRDLAFAKAWIRCQIDESAARIFKEALKIKNADERKAFLQASCQNDNSLLKDLEILLKRN